MRFGTENKCFTRKLMKNWYKLSVSLYRGTVISVKNSVIHNLPPVNCTFFIENENAILK